MIVHIVWVYCIFSIAWMILGFAIRAASMRYPSLILSKRMALLLASVPLLAAVPIAMSSLLKDAELPLPYTFNLLMAGVPLLVGSCATGAFYHAQEIRRE